MTDDDDGMSGYWRDVKAARQAKRASNRQSSAEMLAEAGIEFEAKNGDAHLVVRALGHVIDFWPGTGLWIARKYPNTRKYGVRSLIAACTPQGSTS